MANANPALEQFIKSIPLFSYCATEDLTEVLRLLRPVELKAGDVLFKQGEPGRAMWVLGKGVEVSLATSSAQGRPVVVAYAREGDVVGEMALVDDGPRSATAVVVEGGPAQQIDAQEFHAIRGTYTPAAFKIMRKICLDLCRRLRATNDRIVPPGGGAIATPGRAKGRRPDVPTLEAFPAFHGLPAVVKLALSQKLELLDLPEVTPIFAEGEATDGAYFIVEGEVSVGRNGKTLANLPAGTMFGIVSCIDEGVRSASCVTTGAARLLRMSDRDFDHLFASGNRFAFQMVDLVARQLVQHVRDANRMLPLPGRPSGIAGVAKPLEPTLTADRQVPVPAVIEPEEPIPNELEILEIDVSMPLELELDVAEHMAAKLG